MGAVRDVASLADVRRIVSGWGCSVVAELAGTIALTVYAFDQGGAALVGVYGLARTLPGAVVAPWIMGLSDRTRREVLLRLTTSLRTVLLGGAAAAAALQGPTGIVIGLAAASSMLASTYRPLMIATMPWLVRSPAQLGAVNVLATTTESTGSLVGPLAAAVLLVVGPTWATMALAAGVLALGAVGLWWVRLEGETGRSEPDGGGWAGDAWRGLRELAGVAPPGGMVVLLYAQTFVKGALSVLVVVLAVDVIGADESVVGWLYGALGLGGLIGGAVAAAVVRADRLGRAFVTGLFLWGLPLLLLASAPGLATALVAFAVVGAGNAVQDVGGGTLTPRLFHPAVLGRVLGAEELVVFAGAGSGAAVAAPLIAAAGPRWTLVVLGAALVALTAGYALRFVQIDRSLPTAEPHADLMRALPMFAVLPLAAVDLLVTRLRPRQYPSGEAVVRENDDGADYQFVVAGHADVTVRGVFRRTLGPGDGFGEIALLRSIPRTATVVATEPLQTLSLRRADFLAAVTGNRQSAASAEHLASTTLEADPPVDDPPGDDGL